LRLMFECATPRDLAPRIRALRQATSSCRVQAIEPRPNRAAASPSFAQRRLWFIDKLGTAHTVYNISHAVKLTGALDLDALDHAVGDLLARHAALRSRFPEIDGRPGVVVDPPSVRGNLEVLDPSAPRTLEEALGAFESHAVLPFDLHLDRLVRVFVIPVTSGGDGPTHLLGVVVHHIISDGWSMALAIRELTAFYNARRAGAPAGLEPLRVDYYDVAASQNTAPAGGAFDAGLQYWLWARRDAPQRLDLPYDFPVPPRRSWRGARMAFEISEELTGRVKALSQRARATDFMTLLGVYAVLLHKMSGMRDLVVGTVIANRHRPETEPLVGFLVNPVAIRTLVQ